MSTPSIYLVNPACGTTYSGLSECLDLFGRRALCANLALPTLAALVPEGRFRVVLCDESVDELRDGYFWLQNWLYDEERFASRGAAGVAYEQPSPGSRPADSPTRLGLS